MLDLTSDIVEVSLEHDKYKSAIIRPLCALLHCSGVVVVQSSASVIKHLSFCYSSPR